MIYFLFDYCFGDVHGGFEDLVAISTDIDTLLSNTRGSEVWSLACGADWPVLLCRWSGSYNHEWTWYKAHSWDKFTVESETT